MSAESQPFMFELLSEHQAKAWGDGRIENLRFNPEDGMLSYRITAHPESNILFKVPAARVQRWREAEDKIKAMTISHDRTRVRSADAPHVSSEMQGDLPRDCQLKRGFE